MSIPDKYVGSALAAVAAAIALAVVKSRWVSRRRPYPPGPKGYPIIGNLLDLPENVPENPAWEGFAKMAQVHGTDLLHLDIMGSHLIVLNSSEAAADLLERRSVAYADRPRCVMAGELMEDSWFFALIQSGNLWRAHRRLFHRFFDASAVGQFDDKVHEAVNIFLRRLSESPEHLLNHVGFLTGSLTLSIAYGANIESESDQFYSASEGAMAAVSISLMPGSFFVDVLPILKYVPGWFPGAGFKRLAKKAKKNLGNALNLPFQHVKKTLEAGTPIAPSIVATCLGELPELIEEGIDEGIIRDVSGTVHLAGEVTTSFIIGSFFLAATLHPEIVRLGQQELDEVLRGERLPDFSDKPRLPYISAIVKEVLRWRPPVPLGVPRRLMEDDVYNGWFIPAGTIIMDNKWAMFRDESVYPNAHIFNPGRFLKDGQINPDVNDPEQSVFGYSRRICPGRHFALRVMFLTIARTLATFDISQCLDKNGDPIIPKGESFPGVISGPLPFKSLVNPRSAQALALIGGHSENRRMAMRV